MSGQGSGGYPQGQGGQNSQQQMIYQQQMMRAQMQQQQGMQGMQQSYGMQGGGMQGYQQQHNMQQQMMGQPAPQMNQQQQSQPRSPSVHVLQQGMNMSQSPMGVGNPLSVGGMSQQHNMGGPGSVQGPLSVQPIGGPQSTGTDYCGPQSVNQTQQPLSVPQPTGGPQSVGPLSVNQQPMSVNPSTPNNPASQPNLAPSTPAQQDVANNWSCTSHLPKEPLSPEPSPALVSDPAAHVKSLILKDLRHSIVRMNIVAGDSLKERKQEGSSGRTAEEIQEDQLKTMDNFLVVCDQIETNLTILIETSRHIQKFEKIFDKDPNKDVTQGMNAVENYIESTQTTQKLLDNAMSHLNKTREKLKKREHMGNDSMDFS